MIEVHVIYKPIKDNYIRDDTSAKLLRAMLIDTHKPAKPHPMNNHVRVFVNKRIPFPEPWNQFTETSVTAVFLNNKVSWNY